MRWRDTVTRERMRLAIILSSHPDVQVRQVWEGMRYKFYEDLRSSRRLLGDARAVIETRLEENGGHIRSEARREGGQPMAKSWLGSFDALLRDADRRGMMDGTHAPHGQMTLTFSR